MSEATLEAVGFYGLSIPILIFGVLVVTARDTVHSILFLIANFLFVAGLYVLMRAEFVAAIQVLVYAGGIVVLYLFVVMLVNLKRPPEAHSAPQRRGGAGVLLAALVLVQFAAILGYSGARAPAAPAGAGGGVSGIAGNTEQVGWLLYTDYLVPFEVASMLLLVAMVGAIVLAKREL